ncbi:MAG: F0F1 ATP synthase subunit A [Planctomycetes bacterium]|nr:F0F1 ATP synthase subunit A [Planctomycetota bacterium]
MSSPVDHVKDIPYFAISEDGTILFPKVTHVGHETKVDWGGKILGGEAYPAFFTVHGFSLVLISFLLLFSALRAVRGISARPKTERGVSSQLFEVLVKFIRDDVARPNLGPHGAKYIPLSLTFFFMILFANLWGMVPIYFTATATGNINITAGLALIVFFCLFVLGIKEQGLGPFVKNLVPAGLPAPMLIIMYPIELIGPITKCFSLCIRLFANMVAGHIVLAAFSGLAITASGEANLIGILPAYLMSVGISLLEVFVAFLQAYVFTLLSTVFIGSFIHPEH